MFDLGLILCCFSFLMFQDNIFHSPGQSSIDSIVQTHHGLSKYIYHCVAEFPEGESGVKKKKNETILEAGARDAPGRVHGPWNAI